MSGARLTSTRLWEGIENSQNGSCNTKQATKICKQRVLKNQTLKRPKHWTWSTILICRLRKFDTSTSPICLVVTTQGNFTPEKAIVIRNLYPTSQDDPSVLPYPVQMSLGRPSSREFNDMGGVHLHSMSNKNTGKSQVLK